MIAFGVETDVWCRATASVQWGVPLALAPTGSDRLVFVGNPVARQSLDYVLWQLPSIYVALREGGLTVIHVKHPRSEHGRNWFPNSRDIFKGRRSHS
jgi:hypothetical protein